MKKKIIFSLLLFSFVLNCSYAESVNVKESDYQIVNEVSSDENASVETIKENDSILIFKKNNKIGILDKKTNTLIGQPNIEEIQPFSADNDVEYKIKIQNYIGYLNTNTKSYFLSKCDDMSLMDKYIKVKKDNKYGILDKEGNIILNPIFEKAGVYNNAGTEFLTGSIDGKVKLFYNTGKLVSENEFYTVPMKQNYSLAQDLKPILKSYRKSGSTVYQKNLAESNNKIYEIQEIPVKDKVQVASIQKFENPAVFNEESNLFSVGKNDYIIVKSDYNKIGLNNQKGNEIIPAIYNKINVKKPCEDSSYQVIAAEKNHAYTLYDLKGKVIAEQVYDKVNIYKYGKIYTYSKEGDKWVLKVNNKTIGNLTFNGGDYTFEKTHFHLYSLHRINELLITVLSAA